MGFAIAVERPRRWADSGTVDKAAQWRHLGRNIDCHLHLVGVGHISVNVRAVDLVGNGVAMANAKDAVKSAATHVTGHCDSDAIACFIRRHVL